MGMEYEARLNRFYAITFVLTYWGFILLVSAREMMLR